MLVKAILKSTVLFLGCAVNLFSSSQAGPGWVEKLDYRPYEIFPIKLQINSIPLIEIKVNASPLWVKFDTGCSEGFVLTSAVEDQIEHKVIGTTTERWPDGSYRGESKIIRIPSLEVFGDTFADMETTISDWKIFSTLKFNGLIGLRYFKDKRVTIDYKTMKIGVTDRPLVYATLRNKYGGVLSVLDPPAGQEDLIYVLGHVKGQPSVIYLDTGSSASFIDPDVLDEGDIIEGKKHLMAENVEISMQGFHFVVKQLRVEKQRRGVAFEYPQTVKLGSDFLQDFLITIDKITNRVILQRN